MNLPSGWLDLRVQNSEYRLRLMESSESFVYLVFARCKEEIVWGEKWP